MHFDLAVFFLGPCWYILFTLNFFSYRLYIVNKNLSLVLHCMDFYLSFAFY